MSPNIQELAKLLEKIIYTYYSDANNNDEHDILDAQDGYVEVKSISLKDYIINKSLGKPGSNRSSLMNYIADGVELIASLDAQTIAMTIDDAQIFKTKLTLLLRNLNIISTSKKSVQTPVQINEESVPLEGSAGCQSGNIIQRILFSKLVGLDIDEYIDCIVNKHQIRLLYEENSSLLNLQNQRADKQRHREPPVAKKITHTQPAAQPHPLTPFSMFSFVQNAFSDDCKEQSSEDSKSNSNAYSWPDYYT